MDDVVVARIGKAHGLKGEVTVQLHTDEPEAPPAETALPVDAAAEFDAALPSAHAQTPPATGGTQ